MEDALYFKRTAYKYSEITLFCLKFSPMAIHFHLKAGINSALLQIDFCTE